MSHPGYIREIPLNYAAHPDFMGSPHFIDFAVEQGWFDPEREEAFDVTLVYGVDKERYPRSAMEGELRAAAPIDLRSMMQAVRDPRISKDSTGYGQVAALKPNSRPEMTLLRIAPHRLGHFALYPLPDSRIAHRTSVWQASLSDQGRGRRLYYQ